MKEDNDNHIDDIEDQFDTYEYEPKDDYPERDDQWFYSQRL